MSNGVILTPRIRPAGPNYQFSGTDIILDGSLGSGRPWQMARDLASQLGVEFPADLVSSPVTRSAEGDFGNVAEWAIDSEACGEYVLNQAHALARHFTQILRRELVCVLYPIDGARWCGSDWAFLYFLAECKVVLWLDPTVHLARAAADSGLVDETLTCIPGVLSADILAQFDAANTGLIPLRNKLWMVPPNFRCPPSLAEKDRYDLLVQRAINIKWLYAYAQLFCSAKHIQPADLDPIVDDYYRGRHFDLALSLQERLMRAENIDPYRRGVALLKLQMMRISSMNFDKAATQNIPANFPKQFMGLVILAKGWGHAMTNNPRQADVILTEARSLLAPLRGLPEFLYALNISALVKFRIGHIRDAETMEIEIEEQLCLQKPRRFALEYVNQMNLHRVYRHTGQLKKARYYLDRATATTAGTRSRNDAIYTALNYWRLSELEGRMQDSRTFALECVALFLALETPESISSRTAAGLLNQPWPLRAPFGVDQIYTRLKTQIASHVSSLKEDTAADKVQLSFAFSSEVEPDLFRQSGQPAAAVMMEGLGVIFIPNFENDRLKRPKADDGKKELHDLFSDILLSCLSAEVVNRMDRTKLHKVVVDDRFGRGMPKTLDELAGVALRLNIRWMHHDGRLIGLDENLSEHLQVSAAPGMERIEDRQAHFKRMLAPITLPPDLGDLLRRIDQAGSPIPIGTIGKQHLTGLRTLESAKLCILEIA